MKRFVIAVEETITQEFEVYADNEQEALYLMKEGYEKGEIVVDGGEVQSHQLAVIKPVGNSPEWIKF